MSVIIVIVCVLLGIVSLMAIVGSMLPADHVVTRTISLNQSPMQVWQVMNDFQGMASWHPQLSSVKRLSDQNGHEVWEESYGRNMIIPLETIESEAPRRLVRRITSSDLAFGGEWEYVITPTTNGGCQLTITERGTVRNPLFRFLSRYVIGHASTIENYQKAMATRFGETANIR